MILLAKLKPSFMPHQTFHGILYELPRLMYEIKRVTCVYLLYIIRQVANGQSAFVFCFYWFFSYLCASEGTKKLPPKREYRS